MATQLSITIKQTTINDLEKLYEIERKCFTAEAFTKNQIMFLLQDSNSVSLIAQKNGEIIGFIIGLIQHITGVKAGHIYTIDVAIKHRRKGVGIKLLKELEQIFAKKGAQVCYLEVRTNNVAALELYKKQGYAEVERLRDYYFEGGHGVRLQKRLSQ
jgi:ribosomal-protein-alanine acetyltransferase